MPKDLLSAAKHISYRDVLTVELPGAAGFVESLTDGVLVDALEARRVAGDCRSLYPTEEMEARRAGGGVESALLERADGLATASGRWERAEALGAASALLARADGRCLPPASCWFDLSRCTEAQTGLGGCGSMRGPPSSRLVATG